MRRTTIMLPEDVDARLRLEARRRGASVAAVAREAIEQRLPPQPHGRLSFFAVGDGSPQDASERSMSWSARACGHAGRNAGSAITNHRQPVAVLSPPRSGRLERLLQASDITPGRPLERPLRRFSPQGALSASHALQEDRAER